MAASDSVANHLRAAGAKASRSTINPPPAASTISGAIAARSSGPNWRKLMAGLPRRSGRGNAATRRRGEPFLRVPASPCLRVV